MPSALPEDIGTVLRLYDGIAARLQAISFLFVVFIIAVLGVYILWNFIAKDSGRLPRIDLLRSVALVILWGALFTIVLTMISGARELLTPGAWMKDGVTYTLESEGELHSDGKD